jgi:hypothetical protein
LREWLLCELPALHDGDLLAGAATGAAEALDLLHHIHTLGHAAEHNVLAVQPRGGGGGDEELPSTGTRWPRRGEVGVGGVVMFCE